MGYGLGIVYWDRGLGFEIGDCRWDWGQGWDWKLGLGLEIRIGVSDEIGDWDQDLGLGIMIQDRDQRFGIWDCYWRLGIGEWGL